MGELFNYRLTALCSRCFSRRVGYAVGYRVADWCHAHDAAGRLGVMANLRRVFAFQGRDLDDRILEREARSTFRFFSQYLFDFFAYSRPLNPAQMDRDITISNREYLDRAMAAGKGVLLLTAHLGNWELGGAAVTGLGYPLRVIALPEPNPKVDRFFLERRQRRGLQVIPAGNAVRDVLRVLGRREMVALLADRDYTPRQDRVVFFGEPARLPRGAVWLARHTGAPILPCFMVYNARNHVELHLHEPLYPEAFDGSDSIQRAIVGILEEEIGKAPHQWYMFRDLWNDDSYGGPSAR
jgi:lauroyl/myristoyl acyltransferase